MERITVQREVDPEAAVKGKEDKRFDPVVIQLWFQLQVFLQREMAAVVFGRHGSYKLDDLGRR